MDILMTILQLLMAVGSELHQSAMRLVSNPQTFSTMLVIGFVISLLAWGYLRDRRLRRKLFRLENGGRMSRPEQENYERMKISDGIEDILLDLEVSGKLSRERANVWRRRFANILSSPDLIAKHQKVLKQEIKERLGKNKKPMPLPQDTTNVVPLKQPTKSTFGSSFLNRMKSSA